MMAGIERDCQTRGPYAVRYPEKHPCIGAEFRRRRRRSAGSRSDHDYLLDQLVGRHLAMSLAGQTLLKAGTMTRQASTELLAQFLGPRTVAGLTFAAEAFLYIIAFRLIPLSIALPCTAVSYIGAILIGHFFVQRNNNPRSPM